MFLYYETWKLIIEKTPTLLTEMIPQFPKFKKLELSDRGDVEKFTKQFPPYSDFNFVSMWSWDIKRDMTLSWLNQNLVVRFTDYITGEPFYSFLGETLLPETAEALLDFSRRNGLMPMLKLVPEIVAEKLGKNIFNITNDPNHTDYVLSTEKLRTYEGTELSNKRREVSRFIRLHTDFRFATLDINSPETNKNIWRLSAVWLAAKDSRRTVEEEHEFLALHRCLESSFSAGLLFTGVYVEEILGAFWLTEDLQNGYSISHFEKADLKRFPGIFAYLKQQMATVFSQRGIDYINLEQDLGVEGLRRSKNSYFPQIYLRKYTITKT